LKEKIQQLNMMATIYGCATVTIVALTGKDSNAGLAGVSVSRPVQIKETIDGHTFFTVPRFISVEREQSIWSSRAWTLQEEVLSQRIFQFTESQVDFTCLLGSISEGLDTDTASKEYQPQHPTTSMIHMITRVQSVSVPHAPH
jgi:hypothetical protein